MNAMLALYGIVLAGWVGPEITEPISPTTEIRPEKPARQQQSHPQSAVARPIRTMSEGATRQPRMPVPPTDPRTYAYGNLPLPPTMNDSGMLPETGMGGMGPRNDLAASAENGGRRRPTKRLLTVTGPAPATSPFMLLNSTTNNGTINPYTAYVRPVQDQQRVSQEMDQAENAADQPAAVYPRAFQNYGSYFPDYGAGR